MDVLLILAILLYGQSMMDKQTRNLILSLLPKWMALIILLVWWFGISNEGYNRTYDKTHGGGFDWNRGELSTQSIQGIPDSRADILNNT